MPSARREQVEDVARRIRARARGSRVFSYTVRGRLLALEQELQDNRQLNRRIAELTDVVAELLLPLQDRDEAKSGEILEKYRQGL